MDEKDFITYCCSSSTQLSLITDHTDIKASERDIIASFIKYMKAEYRLNIVEWEPFSDSYPKYMFLSGDKGILSYISFRYIHSHSNITPNDLSCESKGVLSTVAAAASQLDRPVFYIYLINAKDRAEILFETDEQIRDRWLSADFSSDVYTPIASEMGDFQNLLSLLLDLKRNGVKLS